MNNQQFRIGDHVQPVDPDELLEHCPTYSTTNTTHGIVQNIDSDYSASVGVQWVTNGSVNPIVYYHHPHELMPASVCTADMWLVYRDSKGHKHYQPWYEIAEVGGLVDPDTGEDCDVIGWTTGPVD